MNGNNLKEQLITTDERNITNIRKDEVFYIIKKVF